MNYRQQFLFAVTLAQPQVLPIQAPHHPYTHLAPQQGITPNSMVAYGLSAGKHNAEGRAITIDLPNCRVVNTYVPNAGMQLERLKYRVETWDPAMLAYLQELEATKPVVWTGDLNVAEKDYDRFFASNYKQVWQA